MSFKILMAGVTHHGRIRTNNEDNLYMGGKYLALGIQDLSEILYVEKSSRPWTAAGVFDGMGGENAGETAAFTGLKHSLRVWLHGRRSLCGRKIFWSIHARP